MGKAYPADKGSSMCRGSEAGESLAHLGSAKRCRVGGGACRRGRRGWSACGQAQEDAGGGLSGRAWAAGEKRNR